MNLAISQMLGRFDLQSSTDYREALREIIQEIALLGLWRSKFFEHAAFYGGTCLRILHGLDRFSEDLDFSLLTPNSNFDLTKYNRAVQTELESYGFETTILTKDKISDSSILSAFIKEDTYMQIIKIEAPQSIQNQIQKGSVLKIKMEVDINPPPLFQTESKFIVEPVPFSVLTYRLPDLFSGKMHAILCRKWKTRVKGRDWYDFGWFVSKKIPLSLTHLEARLRQSGHFSGNESLEKETFLSMLQKRIADVDFESAKKDISPFLKDPSVVSLWNDTFFNHVARLITFSPNLNETES